MKVEQTTEIRKLRNAPGCGREEDSRTSWRATIQSKHPIERVLWGSLLTRSGLHFNYPVLGILLSGPGGDKTSRLFSSPFVAGTTYFWRRASCKDLVRLLPGHQASPTATPRQPPLFLTYFSLRTTVDIIHGREEHSRQATGVDALPQLDSSISDASDPATDGVLRIPGLPQCSRRQSSSRLGTAQTDALYVRGICPEGRQRPRTDPPWTAMIHDQNF